jgi:hypothetical protein
MICWSKHVIENVPKYEQLRQQKIKANTKKLKSLGLPALAAPLLPATTLKK